MDSAQNDAAVYDSGLCRAVQAFSCFFVILCKIFGKTHRKIAVDREEEKTERFIAVKERIRCKYLAFLIR